MISLKANIVIKLYCCALSTEASNWSRLVLEIRDSVRRSAMKSSSTPAHLFWGWRFAGLGGSPGSSSNGKTKRSLPLHPSLAPAALNPQTRKITCLWTKSHSIIRKCGSVLFTVKQAVSAAWTPFRTVRRRFCVFFTRISSDDLQPGVTELTLRYKISLQFFFHPLVLFCFVLFSACLLILTWKGCWAGW